MVCGQIKLPGTKPASLKVPVSQYACTLPTSYSLSSRELYVERERERDYSLLQRWCAFCILALCLTTVVGLYLDYRMDVAYHTSRVSLISILPLFCLSREVQENKSLLRYS